MFNSFSKKEKAGYGKLGGDTCQAVIGRLCLSHLQVGSRGQHRLTCGIGSRVSVDWSTINVDWALTGLSGPDHGTVWAGLARTRVGFSRSHVAI
jgi:hypothetical protein